MDLVSLFQADLDSQQDKFRKALAEKYGVPDEDLDRIISEFLSNTYGPALAVAEAISRSEKPLILFIGKEGCAICQRSLPKREIFLQDHQDISLVRLEYSEPSGLLYHAINQESNGALPLIALISGGSIMKVFTGECIHPEAYEEYYPAMSSRLGKSKICTTR
jgi:hypothetical protein